MRRIKQAGSQVTGGVKDWTALALAGMAMPIAAVALLLVGTKGRERRMAAREVLPEHD